MPQAEAALSPAPPATGMPAGRPSSRGELRAQAAADLASPRRAPASGPAASSRRRAARPTSARRPVSSQEVPAESDISETCSPGQPEAQIVLRQQDLGDLVEDRRLVVPHPDELRRGEAGKDDVAGRRAEDRIGVELGRFGEAARVVPQDAGPQHPVGRVEQRRAVHVARQADAPDARRDRCRARARRAAIACSVAATQCDGSCSDQPGCRRETVSGALPCPTIFWSSIDRGSP